MRPARASTSTGSPTTKGASPRRSTRAGAAVVEVASEASLEGGGASLPPLQAPRTTKVAAMAAWRRGRDGRRRAGTSAPEVQVGRMHEGPEPVLVAPERVTRSLRTL